MNQRAVPSGAHPGPDPMSRPRTPEATAFPPGSADLDDPEGARVARALSHPVRVRILRILEKHGECYCGDLCDAFPLAQSTISQHLKVLRESGLIQGTRCGTAIGYCVDPTRLAAFHRWVGKLVAERATSISAPLLESDP